MMRFVLPFLMLGLVFFATGCGDSIDSLAKDTVKLQKEMIEAMAKGDKDAIEKLEKKAKELEERAKKLQDKKSDEEFKKEMMEAMKKASS